jgi:hypothetical protein
MSNARRPAKSQPARKTKAVKKKVQKARPLAVVPAHAAVPEPKASTVTEFPGPIPVPDVRQEGRYVYGIIQSRDPISFGRMGIGGSGDMVYVVTHGDIGAVVSTSSKSYSASTKRSTASIRRSRANICNRPISPACSWAA